MSAFPAAGVSFLAELALNNDRTWFVEHKSDYEGFVKGPSQEVFEDFKDLVERMVRAEVDGKLYRIHRDVRFSKDKTPYSPYVRMSAWLAGADPKTACCFHASIEAGQQILGVGMWEFSEPALIKFRELAASGKVDEMLDGLGPVRIFEPELKRIPAGVSASSNHLRRKGLIVWIDIPWDCNDILVDRWSDQLSRLLPAFELLSKL